jgi:hypothetical protein
MKCHWKLCTNSAIKHGKYCSSNCKNKFNVAKRRKKVKILAVEYLGQKCSMCGYSKCMAALEFHHKDPRQKDFGISGSTKSFELIKLELDKCILVCANCHRELHSEMQESEM